MWVSNLLSPGKAASQFLWELLFLSNKGARRMWAIFLVYLWVKFGRVWVDVTCTCQLLLHLRLTKAVSSMRAAMISTLRQPVCLVWTPLCPQKESFLHNRPAPVNSRALPCNPTRGFAGIAMSVTVCDFCHIIQLRMIVVLNLVGL